MSGIDDLIRRRSELIEEIDREISSTHTRDITLLFTDIVGSTSFYEKWGDIAGLQMVLACNDLLFPIIASRGGRVLKTIGDSIMAVFDDPCRAVAATVEMQRAIDRRNDASSEEKRLAVRMGLHRGPAVLEERDVFGDVVNTAARVEAFADGGEIIVTGDVRADAGECGVPLVILGTETIRGRERSVEMYAVDWRGLGEERIAEAWRAKRGRAAAPSGGGSGGPRVELGPISDPVAEEGRLAPLAGRGNPYLNRVMIPHPRMFIGRRGLARRILGRLAGDRPQSLSLVGERRIGKSSLLNFLRSPKARLDSLEEPGTCIFALVDFQQVRSMVAEHLLSLLFAELRRQTGMIIEGKEGYECMRLVGEAAAASGRRLVFLFDEFEALTRNAAIGPDFYAFLRSMANSFPMSFICASGHNLKDLCASREISDSPFFNVFSVFHIGLLDAEDAEELVRGPSASRGIPLAPVLREILAMGGRHPFFLQIACASWFEYLEAEGLDAEIYAGKTVPAPVLEAFREEAWPHFEFALESMPAAEGAALGASAAGDPSCPDDAAVRSLCRRGYLVPGTEEGRFEPFSAEFRRFLDAATST